MTPDLCLCLYDLEEPGIVPVFSIQVLTTGSGLFGHVDRVLDFWLEGLRFIPQPCH